MKKKIIAFSLWGDNPKYTIGAIKNAELIPIIYGPDWIGRFYCGKSVPKDIIQTLYNLPNTEVIEMPEQGDLTGMFWRFYPASDANVSILLSRDTDSRISIREKACVDEWLKSNKSFHIIRDHPLHKIEILGGLWGVKNPKLDNMITLIDNFEKGDYYQTDQVFLKNHIYPLIKNDCFVHDEFFHFNKFRKKIPIKRDNLEYLGQAYSGNDEKDTTYDEVLDLALNNYKKLQKFIDFFKRNF